MPSSRNIAQGPSSPHGSNEEHNVANNDPAAFHAALTPGGSSQPGQTRLSSASAYATRQSQDAQPGQTSSSDAVVRWSSASESAARQQAAQLEQTALSRAPASPHVAPYDPDQPGQPPRRHAPLYSSSASTYVPRQSAGTSSAAQQPRSAAPPAARSQASGAAQVPEYGGDGQPLSHRGAAASQASTASGAPRPTQAYPKLTTVPLEVLSGEILRRPNALNRQDDESTVPVSKTGSATLPPSSEAGSSSAPPLTWGSHPASAAVRPFTRSQGSAAFGRAPAGSASSSTSTSSKRTRPQGDEGGPVSKRHRGKERDPNPQPPSPSPRPGRPRRRSGTPSRCGGRQKLRGKTCEARRSDRRSPRPSDLLLPLPLDPPVRRQLVQAASRRRRVFFLRI